MTRRQKKRMLALTGSLTAVICVGMLIGTVYAQTMEQEQQEGRRSTGDCTAGRTGRGNS